MTLLTTADREPLRKARRVFLLSYSLRTPGPIGSPPFPRETAAALRPPVPLAPRVSRGPGTQLSTPPSEVLLTVD